MLPFLPPFPNQKHAPGGNEASLPQFLNSSSALQNQLGLNASPFMLPAVGGFPNPNALLGSFLNQQQLLQGLQNNIIGALSQPQSFQCNPQIFPQLQGQLISLLGGLQGSNFLSLQQGGLLGGPPLCQNLNQMIGLASNGLPCSQNHGVPPNSHLLLMGSSNPQPGFLANSNPQVAQNKNNMTGFEMQKAIQKSLGPSLPSSSASNYSSGRKWSQPQMVPGQAGGKNFTNNSSDNVVNRTLKPKFNGFGKREQINGSFRKSEAYKSRNALQRGREFPRYDKRGNHNRKDRNSNCSESSGNSTTMRKRHLAVIYSESEIQMWREARKRNFPTRANIEKKLRQSIANEVGMDSNAKIRCKELKEVLAKQAELGVEVAEIPSSYLTGTEEQTPVRWNNKRGRFRHDNRRVKKQKHMNAVPPVQKLVVQKREPTLLRKLLNTDIRRDKSRLLQAFRFMVVNSFFRDLHNKPLVFPLISAKSVAPESEIVVQEKPVDSNDSYKGRNGNAVGSGSQNEPSLLENAEDESDKTGSDVEVLNEPLDEDIVMGNQKSEEGEITE